MEKIVEKIPQDKFVTITNLQREANQTMLDLGQIHLQIRDFELQIKKMTELRQTLEEKFDKASIGLDNIILDLQKNYPNGELDLNDGTVTYEK